MNFKPPAFIQHAPEEIIYESVPYNDLYDVLGVSEKGMKLERMQNTAYVFPLGFYRVVCQTAGTTEFIKVLPLGFQFYEEFGLKIENEMHRDQIPSRTLVLDSIKYSGETFCVIRGRYIEFEKFSPSRHSLYDLGYYLNCVHQFLENKSHEDVKANWIKRKSSFDKVLSCLLNMSLNHPISGLVLTSRHIDIITNYYHLLEFDLDSAQIIHGDLNLGNVLWTRQSPMVIDFENASYSYMPRSYDLGMLAQRLLIDILDIDKRLESQSQLLLGYGYDANESLTSGMIGMSVRSLMILLERSLLKGFKVPQYEWDKFIKLIDDAIKLDAYMKG
ncbi:MAG: aminoglycoside phosphotransferase family protein [Methyloprofundus sp.]|nr:aminoglycoside phosphotransferase family protein [Methyloprofundus sp.]